ncbi:hypothetical protein [Mycoplasma sp. Z1473D]
MDDELFKLENVKFILDPSLKNKLADFSKKPEAHDILRRRGQTIYSEVKAQLPYDMRPNRAKYNQQKHMRDRFKITERISRKKATNGELRVTLGFRGINKEKDAKSIYPLVQLWGSRRKYQGSSSWIQFKTSRNPDLLRKTAKTQMQGIKSEVIQAYENYASEINKKGEN